MEVSFKELNKSLILESDYINWINDSQINNFLEVRFNKQNKDDLIDYVNNINKSHQDFLFAIFQENKHIGNVKLYNIDNNHQFGEIGIVIGNKNLHAKGIGAKAISFINSFAKNECKLRKVIASAYSTNIPSISLFAKCGFKKAGVLKNHYLSQKKLVDKVYLEYFL